MATQEVKKEEGKRRIDLSKLKEESGSKDYSLYEREYEARPEKSQDGGSN